MVNRSKSQFLIPLIAGQKNQNINNISEWFSKLAPIMILGIVMVDRQKSISTAVHDVKKLRDYLKQSVRDNTDQIRTKVIATYEIWEDIKEHLDKNSSIETLILEWPHQIEHLGLETDELINNPPVDIRIVKGQFNHVPQSVLIPVRGGPQAEEAIRISLGLAKIFKTTITLQRVFSSHEQSQKLDKGFKGLARILKELPEIEVEKIISDNIGAAILSSSCEKDLVILGTNQQSVKGGASFGVITDQILNNCPADVIAVKTKRTAKPESPEFSSKAISVLVDKWFAENTFDADEFSDIKSLINFKEKLGMTISLALPSLNEEETIGDVIKTAKDNFLEKYPLLDEIVLVDSGSEDKTRQIAEDLGIKVFLNQDILKDYGFRMGKGEVLWKSLYLTQGDIIFWLDTDIKNFGPKFIYGILGPLLTRENIKFVKGFYKRPISEKKGGIRVGEGGRVTELTARPLLNLFYPELSGIIQPLSGEYGGKRDALENLTFTSGYGVETSLLIDMVENYRLSSIGQVNLDMRVHRNQPLQNLSMMSFAIIQTILSKLSQRFSINFLDEINSTMNMIQYKGDRFFLDVKEITELERPPMATVREYREKFSNRFD